VRARLHRHPLAAVAAAVGLAVSLGWSIPAGAAASLPAFGAPVVDDAHVVPDDVERTIDDELNDFQARSGNQIAVAVVKTTGGTSIEDYSIDLARAWGVGEKGKDNGVLVLIAYDDHKLRIEVGRGNEGELTDLEAGRIIREQMTPRLKAGDVGGAIEAGTSAIRVALGDQLAVAPAPVAQPAGGGGGGFPWTAIVFLLFPLLSILGGFGRRRRRFGWGSPIFFGGGLGGFGGGWGGGSRGGGGSGGFSGGGGGGFGGGGASGSW